MTAKTLVACAGLVLLTVACAPDWPADYREAHAIQVRPTVEEAVVDLSGPAMTDADRLAVEKAARTYLLRGEGPLRLVLPATAQDRADALTALIARQGVAAADVAVAMIAVPDGQTTPPLALVRFRAWTAEVPDCGDWRGQRAMQESNQPWANFGCANQRNLGLMVADPRDLLRARSMDPRDGNRPARVIDAYRAGESTSSAGVGPVSVSDVEGGAEEESGGGGGFGGN